MPHTRERLMESAGKAFVNGFGAVIEIAPDGLDPFFIDGRGETCVIRAALPDDFDGAIADAFWKGGADTLERIFRGGRALERAYLSGRMQIGGDMAVMSRLILEQSA